MPRVCYDAGHGLNTGAGGYVQEDIAALAITLAAKERSKSFWGLDVTLTRGTDDINPSLANRCQIANAVNADVFVSIHCNAGHGTGFESYRCPDSVEGARIQESIHARIPALNVKDRGRKEANFFVLRNTFMPAVLVECCFVDNQLDAERLHDPTFLQLMGDALADGVAAYLGLEPKEEEDTLQDWEREAGCQALDYLAEKGLVHNPEQWKEKLGDSVTAWLFFTMMVRVVKFQNKE